MAFFVSRATITLIAGITLCMVGCAGKTSYLPVSNTNTDSYLPKTKTVVFGPLYYDLKKSVLKPEALSVLFTVGAFLKNNSQYTLIIEGLADDRNSNQYQKWLAEERAKGAYNWLTSYGLFKIDEKRITMRSYGNDKMADARCGETDTCHAKNRRVELRAYMP